MNVEQYIKMIRDRHPKAVDVFTQGLCFEFYLLLKVRYPDAKAFYDVNHVITEIKGKYYDITGEVEKTKFHTLMTTDFPNRIEQGHLNS